MIPLDFRTHVVDWKATFHPILGRRPTPEEWEYLRSLPESCKFRYREQLGPDLYFWSYTKNSKNGMWVASGDKINVAREKAKVCASKRKDKKNEKERQKYRENPQAVIKRTSEYQRRNREKGRLRHREWSQKNPDKIKKYHKTEFQKTLTVPRKRIVKLLRMRLRCAVANSVFHGRKTEYESAQFLIWLAAHEGISNLLDYEIDHLIPMSEWDLTTRENQEAANAPENVQWLTIAENSAKSDCMPTPEQITKHRALVAQWRAETSALAA